MWLLLLITREPQGLDRLFRLTVVSLTQSFHTSHLKHNLMYLPPFQPHRCYHLGTPSITFSNRKFWCFLIFCNYASLCCCSTSYCWNYTWQHFPLFPLGHNYATFTWPCREGSVGGSTLWICPDSQRCSPPGDLQSGWTHRLSLATLKWGD